MTRYIVKVYKGCSYYPDRKLQSVSRGRVDKRMEQLRREGFEPKLIEVPESR